MFISLPAKKHKKNRTHFTASEFFINVLMNKREAQGRPYR